MKKSYHGTWTGEGAPRSGLIGQLLEDPYFVLARRIQSRSTQPYRSERSVKRGFEAIRRTVKTESFFPELLKFTYEEIEGNPLRGPRVARVAVRVAFAQGNTCYLVRALCALSEALLKAPPQKAVEKFKLYKKVRRLLTIATSISPGCRLCQIEPAYELVRVTGKEMLDEGFETDLECGLVAVDHCIELAAGVSPWHGLAMGLRGQMLALSGRRSEGLADAGKALCLLTPEDGRHYRRALFNYARMAAMTGLAENVARAQELLPILKVHFSQAKGATKAKIRWMEGVIIPAGGASWAMRFRAFGKLRQALIIYAKLGMAQETLWVAEDMISLAYPDRAAIVMITERVLECSELIENLDLESVDAVIELHSEASTRINVFNDLNPREWGGDPRRLVDWDPTGSVGARLIELRSVTDRSETAMPGIELADPVREGVRRGRMIKVPAIPFATSGN